MTSGSLRCGRRLQPAAFCDAPAPLWSAVPLSGTVHKEGVYSCIDHGCVSKLVHTCVLWQDHARIFRTADSPASHVPRRTFHP